MGRDLARALARRLPTPSALIGHTLWYGAATAAAQGSAWIATVLLARGLSMSEFAAYGYYQLTVVTAAAYGSVGLGLTTSRLVAEGAPGRAAPWGALGALALGAALLVAAILSMLPEAWVAGGLDVPRWLLALGAAVTALQAMPEGAVLGLERFRAVTAVSLLSGVGRLGAAWLAAQRGAPVLAMAGLVAAAALRIAGFGAVLLRAVGLTDLRRGATIGPAEVVRIVRVAAPLFATSLVSASGAWLVGRFILARGEHPFALYMIGIYWFSVGLWLPNLIGRVLLLRLGRTLRTSRGASVALVRQSIVTAAAAAGVLGLGALVAGPRVLALYGPDYAANGLLIGAFLGAALLGAPKDSLAHALIADDGQIEWLKYTAARFVLLLATAALAGGTGVWAAALAFAAGEACLVVLGFRGCRRRRLV